MGLMDYCPNPRSLKRSIQTFNATVASRPKLARGLTLAPTLVLTSLFTIAAFSGSASAQWCSIPILSRYTGIAGTILQGIPIIIGCGILVVGAVYASGGNYLGLLIAALVGVVAIGIGFGLPSIVEWGATDGTTLQSLDMQCMFGEGGGGE